MTYNKNILQRIKDYKSKIRFFHIPKNAGCYFIRKTSSQNKHIINLGHIECVLRKHKIGYYDICIIRNPLERLISIFDYLKGGGMNNFTDNKAYRMVNNFKSLDELCESYYNRNKKHHKLAKQIFFWKNNQKKIHLYQLPIKYHLQHFFPQTFFVDFEKINKVIHINNIDDELYTLFKIPKINKNKINMSKKLNIKNMKYINMIIHDKYNFDVINYNKFTYDQ